jgi:predicted metal-dependent hydrolase
MKGSRRERDATGSGDAPVSYRWIGPGGEEIPVEIRHRPVRILRLRVLPDGSLSVVAPRRSDIRGFLDEKAGWIRRKREEIQTLAAPPGGSAHLFLLDGRGCTLKQGPGSGRPRDDPCTITYTTPSALKRWIAFQLREDLTARVRDHASRMGVTPGRITLRVQRSRWASCSSRGGLSFNLRTLALPPRLRDYLVIHELAHLREPNHSARYWNLVKRYCPGLEECERELSRHWILIERNEIWRVILSR